MIAISVPDPRAGTARLYRDGDADGKVISSEVVPLGPCSAVGRYS
jgi:hypothetical protein